MEKTKEVAAKLVIKGPTKQLEPVAPMSVQTNKTPVTKTVPNTNKAQEQELITLKEELEAQEALRAREHEGKKAAEEEQKKLAESLQKGHQAYDRLKEEKEKLL